MITAPKGFKAAGVACGIKRSGKPDLALIYSAVPATAAGVFTGNQVKAAPIIVSQNHIKAGTAQAIVVNAGNANCWTGKKGLKDAWQMAAEAGKALNIPSHKVLVASTGVIGKPFPTQKVKAGIRLAAKKLSKAGGKAAAKAILTTDKRAKEIAVKVGGITIAGMAKGSGMIAPGMATMLAFITTDAKIDQRSLQKILKAAVNQSFNMVSVDNCMSTNDCVFALANGMSNSKFEIRNSKLVKAFEYVCEYLAKAIAADGEGATKLMTVKVSGARSEKEAKAAVKAVTGSFLLKAAVYGRDKNTGRILQAIGATPVKVNWEKFKFSWKMGNKEDIISADLAAGKFSAVGWGCDLTEGYVRINAKYHT